MTFHIGYHCVGKGQPIVLLHSSLSSSQQWRALTQQLQDRYQVIAIDLSGYGETPSPVEQEAYTLQHEVDLIQQVLARTIGSQTAYHLVGHSFGGATALRLAYQYPQRIRSLSLYEPVAFHLLKPDTPERQEIQQVSGAVREYLEQQQPHRAAASFIDYWNRPGAFDALPVGTRTLFAESIHKVVLDFQALITEPLQLKDYRALPCPTCLIYGKQSPSATRRIIQHLTETLPETELHGIDAGHMAPITHAEQVNAIIERFITAHSQ